MEARCFENKPHAIDPSEGIAQGGCGQGAFALGSAIRLVSIRRRDVANAAEPVGRGGDVRLQHAGDAIAGQQLGEPHNRGAEVGGAAAARFCGAQRRLDRLCLADAAQRLRTVRAISPHAFDADRRRDSVSARGDHSRYILRVRAAVHERKRSVAPKVMMRVDDRHVGSDRRLRRRSLPRWFLHSRSRLDLATAMRESAPAPLLSV
jgi:hypothetical protein